MTDTVSTAVRSRIMSRIRGKHTGPERIVQAYLKRRRYGFKQHHRIARYRVDFALMRKRLALFIDGCFWHKCPRCFRPPKSNTRYWRWKIADNLARDRRIDGVIRAAGWKTLHLWEHEVKRGTFKSRLAKTLAAA